MIIDEFTYLPVSKQRKWALRKAKEGKCIICGIKAKRSRCDTHYMYMKLYELKKIRNENL